MACAALRRAASALWLLAGATGISISDTHALRQQSEAGADRSEALRQQAGAEAAAQSWQQVLSLETRAARAREAGLHHRIAQDLERAERAQEAWRSAAMEKKSVLAVISHYVPGKAGGEARRNHALRETLAAMHAWPGVDLTIYVLTNKIVEGLRGTVKDQVLISEEPVCSETWKHKFCVPWEAIRVLRSASTGGKPTTKLGYELVDEPVYDAYIYSESDIIIPETTFHFWRYHVDTLYKRGYLLLPMRAEDKILTSDVIAVDCFTQDCVNKTEVLRDDEESAIALYSTSRDRHYLRPFNPYSGCFMMSNLQFKDYLESPMWNYREIWKHKYSPWGVRETAASGLLWAPGFGKETGLTHLKMEVWHQIPMNGVGKGDPKNRIDPTSFHRVDEYHDKVTECLNGTQRCGKLTPLRHL